MEGNSVDAVTVIRDYMLEHNVDEHKIALYIDTLQRHAWNILLESFHIALQYYEKKFGIFKLYDKHKKLIAIY